MSGPENKLPSYPDKKKWEIELCVDGVSFHKKGPYKELIIGPGKTIIFYDSQKQIYIERNGSVSNLRRFPQTKPFRK